MKEESKNNISGKQENRNDIKTTFVNGKVVNCNKLNLRKEPSIKAEILMELVYGNRVQVLQDYDDEKFYHVCSEVGIEGYCMKEYISVK